MKSFRQSKPRPKKNLLIPGRDAVITALSEGKELERIFIRATLKTPETQRIHELATERNIPISRVPEEKLNFFNVYNHDGVVALLARIKYQNLQDIISFVTESGKAPLLLLLDGVTDIRNIGGIARSAFCFGVDAIVVPEKGSASINEEAILSSAGALEQIPVCRVGSLEAAIEEIKLNGIRVFATLMNAKTKIGDADFTLPSAIIIGAEDTGIQSQLIKMADEAIKIPMSGNFDSLNVSVATGVVLYEAAKSRANG